MPGKTLILGLAAGYHYNDVRPFLASLDRAAYTGDLVLFVSETTRDLDRMGRHPAAIIPIERTSGMENLPYNGLRYFLYREWLTSCGQTYDRILLTDVRDVIFQYDPFAHAWPDGVNCTLEDRIVTVGTCPFNAHWVREHLGRNALAEVADRPVSCSGTTVADHGSMLTYLRLMTDRLTPPTLGERMAGYDQGVHNHLLHTGQIPNLTLHDNTGPILTLAQTREEPIVDAQGYVLNDAGKRPHMVHQYDRKPGLFQHLRGRFAA
ncbi:hypothetical protein [Pseudodesulfovibrio sp. S3]|uniref:hypothetical protein n=1 Tax=unclassified Pseudodesulfovibrio TaxID=2661612 RepID=UPI000FEBAE57|nr:hypothetical protein [Pseudodesulfovibrio sp. S3]MCJ2163326.1 hypothetical protein [Pseudodesulfovibrio sp. S3-i]RWU06566.1 hypothetical protein DWB63_02050 [Pseudodesulfovibrio sp. S3]